jgi:hypothetical protein
MDMTWARKQKYTAQNKNACSNTLSLYKCYAFRLKYRATTQHSQSQDCVRAGAPT